MDLSKLTPLPLRAKEYKTDAILDCSVWFVEHGPEGDESDCFDVFEDPSREECEFHILARNAFDVMMRRGWGVVPRYAGRPGTFWAVPQLTPGIIMPEHSSWPDPFTALVEADKWYKANVEKVT